MNYEVFELNIDKRNLINSYLVNDSNLDGETAFMGAHDSGSANQGDNYFLHNEFGIRINGNNVIIFGKDQELIKGEFSKLEKLSQGDKNGNQI